MLNALIAIMGDTFDRVSEVRPSFPIGAFSVALLPYCARRSCGPCASEAARAICATHVQSRGRRNGGGGGRGEERGEERGW